MSQIKSYVSDAKSKKDLKDRERYEEDKRALKDIRKRNTQKEEMLRVKSKLKAEKIKSFNQSSVGSLINKVKENQARQNNKTNNNVFSSSFGSGVDYSLGVKTEQSKIKRSSKKKRRVANKQVQEVSFIDRENIFTRK